MEWVETTGKTIEEALDAALDQLGVDEDDAEYEVLEEPKPGLFGRVRGEARLRARVRPTKPRAKDEGRERRPRAKKAAASVATSTSTESASVETLVADRPASIEASPAAKPATRSRKAAPTTADGAKTGSRGATRSGSPAAAVADGDADAVAEIATTFVRGLLDAFGARADVTSSFESGVGVHVRIEGRELGYLIGQKGLTLSAIQELTRTYVYYRAGHDVTRVFVDVSGYREKRKVALEAFVRRVAAEVVASGQRRVLEAMPAADRKIVHDTVNDIAGVRSESEGEEPSRRVVIEPQS